MLRLHQFSQQTKNKSRGSISLLSIVWVAITLFGVAAITRATVVVHHRAVVQTNADAIALAAADHGDETARQFARLLNVRVVSMKRGAHTVTVRIFAHGQNAEATAFRPM